MVASYFGYNGLEGNQHVTTVNVSGTSYALSWVIQGKEPSELPFLRDCAQGNVHFRENRWIFYFFSNFLSWLHFQFTNSCNAEQLTPQLDFACG